MRFRNKKRSSDKSFLSNISDKAGSSAVGSLLAIVLAQSLGLVGVALATSIAKILTTAWYVPWTICERLNLQLLTFLRKGYADPFWRSLPGIILFLMISFWLPSTSKGLWLALSGTIAVVVNILSFEGWDYFVHFRRHRKTPHEPTTMPN